MPDNDASDLADDIANSATKPASATVDGNSVTQVSISDKIKAAQYQAAQEAAASAPGHFGLRFTQLVPPGCG
jgi:hypothetical protein